MEAALVAVNAARIAEGLEAVALAQWKRRLQYLRTCLEVQGSGGGGFRGLRNKKARTDNDGGSSMNSLGEEDDNNVDDVPAFGSDYLSESECDKSAGESGDDFDGSPYNDVGDGLGVRGSSKQERGKRKESRRRRLHSANLRTAWTNQTFNFADAMAALEGHNAAGESCTVNHNGQPQYCCDKVAVYRSSSYPHSIVHSLTHSLTLAYSLTHSLTNPPTNSITQSFTQSLTHSLTH
jgi:hypothetical protein